MMTETGAVKSSPGQEIIVNPFKLTDTENVKSGMCDDLLNEELETGQQSDELKNSLESLQGPIILLNDDCLLHIFSYLEWWELIGIERVCKKWQEVCQRSWRNKKSLHTGRPDRPITNDDDGFSLPVDNLRQILLKCGDRLDSLTLIHDCGGDDGYLVTDVIGELCPNLVHLSMWGDEFQQGFSPKFISSIKNLKKLELESAYDLKDYALACILVSAKSLEELSLLTPYDLRGPSLFYLNEKIRHLFLDYCESLDAEAVSEAIRRLTDLEKLTLICRRIDFDLKCLELCRNSLKEVYFDQVELFIDKCYVPSFPNLRDLRVHAEICLNDKLLEKLVRACPNLEVLDITAKVQTDFFMWLIRNENNDILTDVGIKSLATLTKLKVLFLRRHEKITSSSLEYLAENMVCPELERVDCRGCSALTNSGAVSLIDRFPKLKCLRLANCKEINMDLISSALELVRQRTNNVPLIISTTGIPNQEYKDGDRIFLEFVQETGSFF